MKTIMQFLAFNINFISTSVLCQSLGYIIKQLLENSNKYSSFCSTRSYQGSVNNEAFSKGCDAGVDTVGKCL